MNAYPNRTYRLSGYKDVGNESRLKLYHSADATASKGFDDEKGMSDVDADIPSYVDKCCADTAHCDGDQPPS